MIKDKEDILRIIKSNHDNIISFGVKRLGLFGSFKREENDAQSDVDLLVEFNVGKKTYDNFINLSLMLENLLGRRVELVTPESISPYIKESIMREVEYVITGP